jgi:hypothetical protein
LIQTRFDTLYICEIKFSRKPLKVNVIDEVQEKIEKLKVPRHISRRPVIIHVNGLSDEVLESQYFSHHVDFSELLCEA